MHNGGGCAPRDAMDGPFLVMWVFFPPTCTCTADCGVSPSGLSDHRSSWPLYM